MKSVDINDVIVYPNVASKIIYLKNIPAGAMYELIDMTGKVIKFEINESMIDVSTVESGIYYLLIKDQNQHLIINERIIVR